MISIHKHIVVETSAPRAFRTFTDGIDRWWPRAHHIGASPLGRVVLEPRPGGRWYAICQDGSEVDTGKVLVWEPPHRVVLAWQITAAWKFDPAFVTEVEVRFVADGARRTRVELEHRHLERYGDAAEVMRQAFDADDGWAAQLAAIARAAIAPKYLMTYETTPDGQARAPAHLAAHRDRLDRFCAEGTLLLAGPVMDGSGRALGVFTTRAAAEAFVADDPFVVHGVVARWTIAEWNDVLM
jgi:uncharacterized protein YciI/uncharacterized protein YndB with AHSA1/START domain